MAEAVSSPVDPTTTTAWRRLTELKSGMQPDLRGWFAKDPQRAERMSFTAGDLFVDLSKNLVTDDILRALVALADEVKLTRRRDAMYRGRSG